MDGKVLAATRASVPSAAPIRHSSDSLAHRGAMAGAGVSKGGESDDDGGGVAGQHRGDADGLVSFIGVHAAILTLSN